MSLHPTVVQFRPVLCNVTSPILWLLTQPSTRPLSQPGVINRMQVLGLRGDPGVSETLGSRGSFLRQQLQHGEQEGAEVGSFLPGPLILIQEDLQQTPRLQLGDASQLPCQEYNCE